MSTPYPPHLAYPSAPPLHRALPAPPRLHWGWVLALNILTRNLFGIVWLFVQANWIRRVRGKSNAFWVALAHLIFLPFLLVTGVIVGLAAAAAHATTNDVAGLLVGFAVLGVVGLYVATVFMMRSEMEAEPIGMVLGGVMTFSLGRFTFSTTCETTTRRTCPRGS